MKNKVVLFSLIVLVVFGVLVMGDTVYAANGKVCVYQYDYTCKRASSHLYKNTAVISGLNSFNALAEYRVNNKKVNGVTFDWRVNDKSKRVLTVTKTGKNSSIGRVVGLRTGGGTVCVYAYKSGKCIASSTFKVTVSNTALRSNIMSELYMPGTSFKLPDTGRIKKDYKKNQSCHPRIMTNSSQMQLVDKFITYAEILHNKKTNLNEYEKLVCNEINEEYNGKDIPEQYFENLYTEYNKILSAAKLYVKRNKSYRYKIVDGSLGTEFRAFEPEIEKTGFVWLLHNARLKNVDAYRTRFSKVSVYNKIKQKYSSGNYTVYAERIKTIMNAVAAFPNWNTKHFLDTGMICYSMGMGYDWIYDYLTPQERIQYAACIKRLGVDEGNSYLRSVYSQQKLRSNWCAVNFSGISIASMAIFEYYPDLCARQIADAARFVPVFLNQLSPDGALSESTGYWILSMRYMSYLLSSLDNTFNSDYGLMDVQGFEESWFFPIYITGRDNTDLKNTLSYNYGDAIGGKMGQSALLYFAEHKSEKCEKSGQSYFGRSMIMLWYKMAFSNPLDYDTSDTQDLLWYPLLMARYNKELLPPEQVNDDLLHQYGIDNFKYFRCDDNISNKRLTNYGLMSDNVMYGKGEKVNIITVNQNYTNSKATYFATKGLNAKGSHRDLDAGSFIFDALGVRWANDFGKTTYEGDRLSYYVKRAEGHNTIVINPSNSPDQNINTSDALTGTCEIKNEDCKNTNAGAIIKFDMSNAYNVANGNTSSRNGNTAKRGYKLFDNNHRLMIQDEINLEEPGDIYWFLQTLVKAEDYELSADGKTVIMKKVNGNGEIVKLKAQLKVTTDNKELAARFSLMDYRCLSKKLWNTVNQQLYNQYSGYKKLAIHLNQKVKNAVITVVLTPIYEESDLNADMGEILPIAEWN